MSVVLQTATALIYSGSDASLTFTPSSTSGTFEAFVLDGRGRRLDATAAVDGANVVVSIPKASWIDGAGGNGFAELFQTDSGTKSKVGWVRFRILPSIEMDSKGAYDYGRHY